VTAERRTEQLSRTILHAVKVSDYYGSTFQGLDLNLQSEADLCRFPLLTRDTLARHGETLMAKGRMPVCFNTSAGTTFDQFGKRRPLLLFKGDEEFHVRKGLQIGALNEVGPVRPILLQLVNLEHGIDPCAIAEGCFLVPLERRFHLEVILNLLRREFSFDGFSQRILMLSGPLSMVKALTLLLQERGVGSDQFEIQLVSCSGTQLTRRWRSLLELCWRAPVYDVYGLSEVPGLHACSCSSCGYFHFSPLAHIEVLALGSNEPVTLGVGRLVATSLYPLASLHPVIRYDTEDLLNVIGPCPKTGDVSFAYLGRLGRAVTLVDQQTVQVLIAPMILGEILDSIPGIAVQPHAIVEQIGLHSKVGFQRWRLNQVTLGRITQVELSIEMYWSPLQYPDATAATIAIIRRQIEESSPALLAATRAGRVEFNIRLTEATMESV
jgi:hypothetical protein